MDTQRWLRAGDIFDRVFAAPRAQRSALVDELCRTDPDLKQIVASMLDAEESALEFEQAAAAIVRRGAEEATATEDAGHAPASPGRVGPWRLVKKLGDGGMGVVWLAERADGQFEQRAALKLIKRGMDSDAVLARFLRERQILARLQHPNIAHLLDGGITDDGRPYFAMEYVEGKALLSYCHDNDLKLEDRIRLFLEVCAAVQFAHQHHVVHRDLKPSNVLVTPAGEVKLLDFGIAKVLVDVGTGEPTLTQARRERPMSPAYAAPEQFSGGRITEATDIYALGCVLYQLLTDKYAYDFRGVSQPEDIRRIIEASDPMPPSRLRLSAPPVPPRRLRGDLDTIVLAALKHDPARRYPSVAAFAEDLRNYLDGKPISARRDHLLYRTYKYVRRHRVGMAATLAVALIGIAAVLFESRGRGGAIAAGSAVAIVDFSNLGPNQQHDWIAATLKNELATEIEAGGKLHTLPGELVSAAHADLPAPTAGGYAPASLGKLRQRLGTDYVLSGSYLVSGAADAPMLRLDLALQDARTGAPLAHFAKSASLSELPDLVEKAGAQLRAEVGVDVNDAATLQQIATAHPSTLDLSRHMGLALDALSRSDPARARDELLDAIAMAPGYAPAYALLAQAWKALGYDAKALAAAQQAAAHSEGLPEVQRMSIAHEVAVQKGDWNRVLDLDRQMLVMEPANPERHMALVRDLRDAGQMDRAQAALAEWRKLPGSGEDPRIDLEAAELANVRSDLDSAVKLAERALNEARRRDLTGLAARAKVAIVKARDYLGKRDGAEAMLAQAADDFRRIGNPKGEGDAHLMLAIVLDEENQGPAARREFQRALEIYEAIGYQAGMSMVYSNLTRMLWRQGDRDAAIRAAERALAIGVERGDLGAQASATVAIAVAHLDDSAEDSVVEEFRRAIALGERAGDLRLRLIATRNLADALRLRGELGQAQQTCEQARALARQLNEPYTIASVSMSCGQISLDRGDVAGASAEFEAVLRAATSSSDLNWQALAQTELAWIDMEQAAEPDCDALGRAADSAERAESVATEANARALLAICLAVQKRTDESSREATRARELRSRVNARLEVSRADLALAQLPDRERETFEPSAAVAALSAIAADAAQRHFVADSLEAKLAQLRLQEQRHSPAAPALRAELRAAAEAHGFAWLLMRMQGRAGN